MKFFLILLILFSIGTVFGQQIGMDTFRELSLEEKVETFFNTYRDGHTYDVAWYAGTIVFQHGYAVMPLLKERLAKADYFHDVAEPKDITLSLISYIMRALHRYSGPQKQVFNPEVPFYELPYNEIQWFFNEYMHRIEDYILAKRVIDQVVLDFTLHIYSVAYPVDDITFTQFEYPFFGTKRFGKQLQYCGNDIKRYFEERLGICDLKIVSPFFE
jgi:hypothetical protein